jgi:hypothetical protein
VRFTQTGWDEETDRATALDRRPVYTACVMSSWRSRHDAHPVLTADLYATGQRRRQLQRGRGLGKCPAADQLIPLEVQNQIHPAVAVDVLEGGPVGRVLPGPDGHVADANGGDVQVLELRGRAVAEA